MATLLILLHESDPYPDRKGYALWTMTGMWERWGVKIDVVKGVDRAPEADVVLPHVDLTVMPAAYRAFLDGRPRVINRGIYDISKRRISTLRVGPGDDYAGPVIVKTDFNSGGIRESTANESAFSGPGQRILRWIRRRRKLDLANATSIPPRRYPIFPSLDDVPGEVFGNESLIVERFVTERAAGLYFAQAYHFFGDRSLCRRLGSRSPIVKEHDSVVIEEVEPDPEIVALRHRMGVDYGKLDYVFRDGEAVLLDINLTVGLSHPPFAEERAECLAPGIRSFLDPPSAAPVHPPPVA